MRIAFLGKGGAGKTTTSAAFTLWAKKYHKHILAIDADVNVHLGRALMMSAPLEPLSENWDNIVSYVMGMRDMHGTQMINTTPPNLESRFINPSDPLDLFLQKFGSYKDGITLLNVGTYKADDVGESCYHAKLGNLAVALHHMLDKQNDLIVADTTAGIDNASTSLFFAYDLNVMVIEPSLRSLQVFKDFEKLSKPFGIHLKALVNKVEDEDDLEFVTSHIDQNQIIGSLPFSESVSDIEKGNPESIYKYAEESSEEFQKIYDELMRLEKDWSTYYKNLLYAHNRLHTEYYDQSMEQDGSLQIQEDFSYEKVIDVFYQKQKEVA